VSAEDTRAALESLLAQRDTLFPFDPAVDVGSEITKFGRRWDDWKAECEALADKLWRQLRPTGIDFVTFDARYGITLRISNDAQRWLDSRAPSW